MNLTDLTKDEIVEIKDYFNFSQKELEDCLQVDDIEIFENVYYFLGDYYNGIDAEILINNYFLTMSTKIKSDMVGKTIFEHTFKGNQLIVKLSSGRVARLYS